MNKCYCFRFYEWKTSKDGKKQPYFIYFKQDKPLTDLHIAASSSSDAIETESGEQDETFEKDEEVTDPEQEWTGHRLLTMAGLFDIWRPDDVRVKSIIKLCISDQNGDLIGEGRCCVHASFERYIFVFRHKSGN